MRESAQTPTATQGLVEAVETDAETGEVVLSLRLDPDHAGMDLYRGEAVLEQRLFLPSEIEEDLLDALDPRGGRHE